MAKVKDLLVNGSSRFIGKIYASDQFISQVANGTAPFVVSSSTVVANLNADMTDGLHVHTGRNNEVNKIVRTDGSGYIQTGYINTNVGTENLAISRIFYEYNNDGYIRKMSPSSFFSVLENSGNDISITVAGQNRKLTVGYASNSDTATKLQTARTIWGQSFDGTSNIGDAGKSQWVFLNNGGEGIYIHASGISWHNSSNSWINDCITFNSAGNVGIGINPSSAKLHVEGDIYTTTGFKKEGSSDSYVLLGGGGHKAISDFSMAHSHPYLPTEQVSQEQASNDDWIKAHALSTLRGHVYNMHSLEWQYLFGISSGKTFGTILRTSYGEGTPRIQVMGLYNGTWSNWREVAYDDNTVKKDGTGASGTWGINITGNASTATKLQTSRKLWNQSFDGTADVNGQIDIIINKQNSSTIVPSSSTIMLGSNGAGHTGYHAGIAFNAIRYNPYVNHIHAWIGLGPYTTTADAECYPLVFATNGSTTTGDAPTEKMRITPSGNVGIGDSNPVYKLEVAGSICGKAIYANRNSSTTDGGVSLYGSVDPMTYGIAFRGTGTYGTHGFVTSANDWATYLTMSDDLTRGWIFRRGSTNVASIAGSGDMAIGQHLKFSNEAHISTNRSTDYHYGYTFNLGDVAKSIGMYSGPAGEAGGVVISPDGCLIYNSSDCGYNLQVRDKDLGSDLTNIATLTFGIEQSGYYTWSRGGFKKNGSDDSYVLLGGGGHKALSDFSMAHSHDYLPLAGGTMNQSSHVVFPGTSTDTNYGGSIEFREVNYAGISQTDWSYAPGITFHWGGRTVGKLGLRSDGNLAWRDQSIIHSGNIGSQSVSYASSAGSATQATNLTPENTAHYFRDPSSSYWRGGMIWGSDGNESMSFVVANSGTRFQFVGGSDIATWGSSTWQSVNPYLTIYSSGIVTPGSATASGGFIKSGYDNNYVLLAGGGHKSLSDFSMSHSHSYLLLSGGWMDTDAQIYFKGAGSSTSVYGTLGFRSTTPSGLTMHYTGAQSKALYLCVNGYDSATDNGGLAIDNDGVTVFGAGDTGSVFRVINEDNVGDGAQFYVTKSSGVFAKYSITASSFYESSDERLKDFYNSVDVDLDKLSSLPKKFFKWKSNPNGEFEIGTSAQELQKIYPQLVDTDDKGYLTVAYDKLSIIALKAIDKLYEMNKNLERRIQLLESKR